MFRIPDNYSGIEISKLTEDGEENRLSPLHSFFFPDIDIGKEEWADNPMLVAEKQLTDCHDFLAVLNPDDTEKELYVRQIILQTINNAKRSFGDPRKIKRFKNRWFRSRKPEYIENLSKIAELINKYQKEQSDTEDEIKLQKIEVFKMLRQFNKNRKLTASLSPRIKEEYRKFLKKYTDA